MGNLMLLGSGNHDVKSLECSGAQAAIGSKIRIHWNVLEAPADLTPHMRSTTILFHREYIDRYKLCLYAKPHNLSDDIDSRYA